MGTAYTPADVNGGDQSQTTLNANFDDIQTALGRCLNVYGDSDTGTNTMQVDFDLNSNDILNGGTANFADIVVDGTSIVAQVAAAAASAAAAATSETNAATSETNAATSATAASAAQTAAEAAQTAAEAAAGGDITLTDNTALAWEVKEGSNDYIIIATTNSSEAITFGNATTNPSYTFAGTGGITSNGNIAISHATIPNLQITDTTNSVASQLYASDAQAGVGTVSNHTFTIFTNNTDVMYLSGAGNIGIGVAPGSNNKVELEDAGTAANNLLKITADDQTPAALLIGNDTYAADDTNGLKAFVNDTGHAFLISSGTISLGVTAGTSAFVMDSTASVIIGANSASSANARLEVEDGGTAKNVLLKVTSDDENPYGIVIGNDSASTTDTDGLVLWTDDSGAAKINARGTGGILQLGVEADSDALIIDDTDGGIYTGGATGSSQGTGTINCGGIYVNGAALTGGFRGALVTNNGNQSIDTATETTITWDQENYDTDTVHDTVTNNDRLNSPAGVSYVRLQAQINFASDAVGIRYVHINDNSGNTVAAARISPDEATDHTINLSSPIIATTGGTSWYRVRVYQSSGSALNVLCSTGNLETSWFAMEIIG